MTCIPGQLKPDHALPGALLTGADPTAVGQLRAAGFTDPVHQAIYMAFTWRATNLAGRLRDQAARITTRRYACRSKSAPTATTD